MFDLLWSVIKFIFECVHVIDLVGGGFVEREGRNTVMREYCDCSCVGWCVCRHC